MRPASPGSSTSAASSCIRTRCAPAISIIRTSSASISIRRPASRGRTSAAWRWRCKALLEELGPDAAGRRPAARAACTSMSASQPRWTFTEVRRAALALSREIERRMPALATSKWWKEERHGVFLDYNQNAKDRTTCSAYSVRPLPDARVSAPLALGRGARLRPGRLHGADHAGALRRDRRSACRHGRCRRARWSRCSSSRRATRRRGWATRPGRRISARWTGEAPRVAPSRAKRPAQGSRACEDAADRRRQLAGQGGRARRPRALEGSAIPRRRGISRVDDVLVDAMRGRSSTWTRIRVNLRHVREAVRPPQETPDPDDDPTRPFRS